MLINYDARSVADVMGLALVRGLAAGSPSAAFIEKAVANGLPREVLRHVRIHQQVVVPAVVELDPGRGDADNPRIRPDQEAGWIAHENGLRKRQGSVIARVRQGISDVLRR